jgi:hypothetical protein
LVEVRSETDKGTDHESEIGETRHASRPAVVALEREGDDGEEEELREIEKKGGVERRRSASIGENRMGKVDGMKQGRDETVP